MARVKTWHIPDEFWQIFEPLVSKKERDSSKVYERRPGAGRKPGDALRFLTAGTEVRSCVRTSRDRCRETSASWICS